MECRDGRLFKRVFVTALPGLSGDYPESRGKMIFNSYLGITRDLSLYGDAGGVASVILAGMWCYAGRQLIWQRPAGR